MAADLQEALRAGATMEALNKELNTDRHLNAVTSAAYQVLASTFNDQMDLAAATPTGTMMYHHVYEWEQVGNPMARLWRLNLGGRGGRRNISWIWKPSASTVPTTTNVNGTDKFLPSPGFDPEKLNRIHTFVWKAPIMEYGVTVTVRPKLSSVLVFPNNHQQGAGGRMGPGLATFSGDVQTITPGAQVQGNFTAAFLGFFNTQADEILDQTVLKKGTSDFADSFHEHLIGSRTTRSRGKTFTLAPNAAAAREGKNIAQAIVADSTRKYYRMAEKRKRRNPVDDEV